MFYNEIKYNMMIKEKSQFLPVKLRLPDTIRVTSVFGVHRLACPDVLPSGNINKFITYNMMKNFENSVFVRKVEVP